MPHQPHSISSGGKIDLGDPRAVTYWARRWGLTADQLRRAAKQVGTDAAALAAYLGKGSAEFGSVSPVENSST